MYLSPPFDQLPTVVSILELNDHNVPVFFFKVYSCNIHLFLPIDLLNQIVLRNKQRYGVDTERSYNSFCLYCFVGVVNEHAEE